MARRVALPKAFRGAAQDLPKRLESNFRALITHVNSWMPSYDDRNAAGDPRSLTLEGDLILGGDVQLSLGATVDGVDVSEAVGSPPFTWAYRNATQSIGNNAWEDVEWNAEWFDEGGWHSNSVTPALVTVDETHLFDVVAQVKFASNATGVRGVRIVHDIAVIGNVVLDPNAADPTTIQVAGSVRAVSGDTIKVQVFQDSGGALDLSGGDESDSWVQVKRA